MSDDSLGQSLLATGVSDLPVLAEQVKNGESNVALIDAEQL